MALAAVPLHFLEEPATHLVSLDALLLKVHLKLNRLLARWSCDEVGPLLAPALFVGQDSLSRTSRTTLCAGAGTWAMLD